MLHPSAAGERVLGSGTFLWYTDIAQIIRFGMPDVAGEVPTRRMPDFVMKALSLTNSQMAMIRHELGRKRLVDS